MTVRTSTPRLHRLRPGQATLTSGAAIAGWASLLDRPRPESAHSRRMAHLGVLAAITALVGYLTWRIGYTMPAGGSGRIVAWVLIAFEAFPLVGLTIKAVTLWNIDTIGPDRVLRILRVPVGISCLWWLVTRRSLQFQVTPKSGPDQRARGRAPWILWALGGVVLFSVAYAVLGLSDWVPWHLSPSSTIAAGSLAGSSSVELQLPGADPIQLQTVRVIETTGNSELVALRADPGDFTALKVMSLWLFHTPPGVIEGIPDGVPAVAARSRTRHGTPVLVRQHG